MKPEELIAMSADASMSMIGTDHMMKLTLLTLKLNSGELATQISDHDTPGLLIAVDVEAEGKGRTGCVLALEERVILAWTTGTIRLKTHSVSIPISDIRSIEHTTEDGGRMMKQRQVVTINADRTWRLLLHWLEQDGEEKIVPFVKGAIAGAIRPVFEAEQGRETPVNQ